MKPYFSNTFLKTTDPKANALTSELKTSSESPRNKTSFSPETVISPKESAR